MTRTPRARLRRWRDLPELELIPTMQTREDWLRSLGDPPAGAIEAPASASVDSVSVKPSEACFSLLQLLRVAIGRLFRSMRAGT